MKQYKEIDTGTEYHVLEFYSEDLLDHSPNITVLNEILKCQVNFKHFKLIDSSILDNKVVYYYEDGVKHNGIGPAEIRNLGKDDKGENVIKTRYYCDGKRVEGDIPEFKAIKRTELLNKMIDNGKLFF